MKRKRNGGLESAGVVERDPRIQKNVRSLLETNGQDCFAGRWTASEMGQQTTFNFSEGQATTTQSDSGGTIAWLDMASLAFQVRCIWRNAKTHVSTHNGQQNPNLAEQQPNPTHSNPTQPNPNPGLVEADAQQRKGGSIPHVFSSGSVEADAQQRKGFAPEPHTA